MAAAAGTFVYVALCEVMPRELQAAWLGLGLLDG